MNCLHLACLLTFCFRIVHTQVTCSFEDGPCGWHNVSDDPQQGWGIWHMGKHTTKRPHDISGFSGPQDDHTHNNLQGSYLYYTYTTSAPMRCVDSQTEIQLESSLLDLTTAANVSFWYVLRGRTVGNLRLFGNNEVLLWDSSVNHTGSENWTQAIVQLQPGVYRITFKASCTLTTNNDIAVDDIVLEGEPLEAVTTTQPDTTTVVPLETSTAAELSNTKNPTTASTLSNKSSLKTIPKLRAEETTTSSRTQTMAEDATGTMTTEETQVSPESPSWIGAVAGGAGGLTATGLAVAGVVIWKMKYAAKSSVVNVAPATTAA